MKIAKLSINDQVELDAFRRFLAIAAWREKEIGECHFKATAEACLEVYGDRGGEGNKHRIAAGLDQ